MTMICGAMVIFVILDYFLIFFASLAGCPLYL